MAALSKQMYSNPGDESAVTKAWESFLQGDTPPTQVLRSLVDLSWQRCQEARVDPNRRSGPQPVSEQDLYLLRERQRELLEASAPVMACARDFLAETGTMMALADTRCTILSTEGDARAVGSAETIHLMPGVSWSEDYCGTNAIGTALAVGQPVQIHSAEHYCAGIKRWTCSATVVRHPADGEVVGVLDVSGLSPTYSRHSLALVVTTASRIESRLKMAEMERRLRLLDHALARWSAVGRSGAVLFDRRGCAIKANEHAHDAIAAVGGERALPEMQRLSALAAGRLRRMAAKTGLPAWMRPEWLEPLMAGGEQIGTLLVVPPPRARTFAPACAALSPGPDGPDPGTPAAADAFAHLVTGDAGMREAMARARQLARSRAPVLLQGETGAGKEEFARGIHGSHPGPYVALNCGGLSRELLASELFGYADGAFTGARKGGMAGKIEAAEGGTLFLDEIGEMPPDMQPHLLRVLEQGEIYRLGENVPRKVNFRLIAATHRDLRQEVAAGRFRMDLYYRVAVTSLRIPPLRERPGDIERLARHFLARFTREHGVGPLELDPAALACLQAHPWPGNVRELRNVIEGAVLTSESGVLGPAALPLELTASDPDRAPAEPIRGGARAPASAPQVCSLAEDEKASIRRAIAATGGNLTQAARRLNIAKSTLYVKMRQYGLGREPAGPAP